VSRRTRHAALTLAMALAGSAALAQDGAWTHFAATPARTGVADVPALPDLSAPAWVYDAGGRFAAMGQASPVIATDGTVVVLGRLDGLPHAIALDAADGAELWRAPIDEPALDSWSSPAIATGLVAVASGSAMVGLDPADGAELWRADLPAIVVNASPAIVGSPRRVLIGTYDPFGGGAQLVAVNADPFDAATNPYEPGEVAASVGISWAAGATPAIDAGLAIIPTVGPDAGAGAGDVRALALSPDALPGTLAWQATNPVEAGFFGSAAATGGTALAASFGFFGARDNSNLLAIDTATGATRWSIAAERTNATPIALGDGRVALSGGLDGFGSLATVQLYEDRGDHAQRLWDLVDATWEDLDGDGAVERGEYLRLGGWSHQPAALRTPDGGLALLVGVPPEPAGPLAVGPGLALLDLDAPPESARFVRAQSDLGGSSPAVGAGVAVSVGPASVAGFALMTGPCVADCDGSGTLDVFDFLCFQNAFDAGEAAADCDGSGTLDVFDFLCFQNAFEDGCP